MKNTKVTFKLVVSWSYNKEDARLVGWFPPCVTTVQILLNFQIQQEMRLQNNIDSFVL